MGLVHGLDTIPVEVFTDKAIEKLFKDYLPGWSGNGIYNYQPGAFTNKIGAQLQILTQVGSHPWNSGDMA